jgi:hypothetical protein
MSVGEAGSLTESTAEKSTMRTEIWGASAIVGLVSGVWYGVAVDSVTSGMLGSGSSSGTGVEVAIAVGTGVFVCSGLLARFGPWLALLLGPLIGFAAGGAVLFAASGAGADGFVLGALAAVVFGTILGSLEVALVLGAVMAAVLRNRAKARLATQQ